MASPLPLSLPLLLLGLLAVCSRFAPGLLPLVDLSASLALRDTRLIGILCLFAAVAVVLLSLPPSLFPALSTAQLDCRFDLCFINLYLFIGANNDTRPAGSKRNLRLNCQRSDKNS